MPALTTAVTRTGLGGPKPANADYTGKAAAVGGPVAIIMQALDQYNGGQAQRSAEK